MGNQHGRRVSIVVPKSIRPLSVDEILHANEESLDRCVEEISYHWLSFWHLRNSFPLWLGFHSRKQLKLKLDLEKKIIRNVLQQFKIDIEDGIDDYDKTTVLSDLNGINNRTRILIENQKDKSCQELREELFQLLRHVLMENKSKLDRLINRLVNKLLFTFRFVDNHPYRLFYTNRRWIYQPNPGYYLIEGEMKIYFRSLLIE